MKFHGKYLAVLGVGLLLVVFLFFRIRSAPNYPVAVIQVVDVAGKPIPGAVVEPNGLRTKPGPYQGGWYAWSEEKGVPNKPVATDRNGTAHVPYPKYVFERIETGQLCLRVQHPDYVPVSPEPHVSTTPPAGAPWKVWFKYLKDAAVSGTLLAKTDPIVLTNGGILKVSVRTDSAGPKDQPLFLQVASLETTSTNAWQRPQPGVVMTRQLAGGSHTVRAVALDEAGSVWFSDVGDIKVEQGKTNELSVELHPGCILHGRLDETVPRPVKNGRVAVEITPEGYARPNYPPGWHAWAEVRADGTFQIDSLPSGVLEISALCDGFVSTNGPGKTRMRYPQVHSFGSNNVSSVTIGMEPTTRLEVQIYDEKGKAMPAAQVWTWPNIRYGEWSATVLLSDCYNSKEMLKPGWKANHFWDSKVPDFSAMSDASGLAVFSNLPVTVDEITVIHSNYVVQAKEDSFGQKRREIEVKLAVGVTNRTSVQLERKDERPITHY